LNQTPDSPQVLVFPPLLFGGTLVLGLVLHWIRPVPALPTLVARVLGLLILVLSGLLARSAEAAMKRAGTNIPPNQPTLAIVTDGPFRFTRNPLYLATAGLYVGIALLVNALCPLVLLLPMLVILDWGVVRCEERYLEAKFGDSYRDYRAWVRRWV
jgi:protein-S-isoprenylcysteine O-methyltransferase Ste14